MVEMKRMDRREVLRVGASTGLGATVAGRAAGRLWAGPTPAGIAAAADVLRRAVASGQVRAAVLHVAGLHVAGPDGGGTVRGATHAFGVADDAPFLLGSISKPITVTALMTLVASGAVDLDDPVRRHLPDVDGEGRERITLRHLLTHVSGLPDQLPDNDALRRGHATLGEFAARAARTPLAFVPGERFLYSSMGILLATRVAEKIAGEEIRALVARTVFRPAGMTRSALGMGSFAPDAVVPCQTEHAAPEAGGGDPAARDWDWNSPWWRSLGAPWGGVQASAADVATVLDEFLFQRGRILPVAVGQLMIRNHNPAGIRARGLGFDVGRVAGAAGCSEATFGHTGSTGTVAWADPASGTICVVLTSLPARATTPHPRDVAAAHVAGDAPRGGG
jgi:CubicO group peptidase (beta-lactamase class C family)